MQPINLAQLELVTGGAAPGGTNNLNAWLPQGGGQGGSGGGTGAEPWGSSAASFGKITAPDMRATSQPNPQIQSPNMNVTSPPDQSWQRGLPGMFSAMGM